MAACGEGRGVPAGAGDPHIAMSSSANSLHPLPGPNVDGRSTALEGLPSLPLSNGYLEPPADVVAIVDAPPTPRILVSPSGLHALLAESNALPSVADVAQPFERLAGVRIDPHRFAARRTRLVVGLTFLDLRTGESTKIDLPSNMNIADLEWSPEGRRVAFLSWDVDGVDVWIAEVEHGTASRVVGPVTEGVGPGFEWMPGGEQLLVWLRPTGRTPAPSRPSASMGPTMEDTAGRRATNRTYPDLLRTTVDEALFRHFATAQLAVVAIAGGTVTNVGEPGLISSAFPSPDARYLLIQRLEEPLSHAVPYDRFARTIDVIDRTGRVVRTVARQPAADEIPIGGVRGGPRNVEWHAQEPATLIWTEALDEGDPKRKVEHRDRLMQHAAPFSDVPRELARTKHRLRSVAWLSTDGEALLREYDRDRRWSTTWLYDFSSREPPRTVIDRSIRDDYGDPGWPVLKRRSDGTEVVIVDDASIFLFGQGASPEGERPFVDRLFLRSGETTRVFESSPGTHAEFIDFVLSTEYDNLLVRRESPTEVPNYVIVNGTSVRYLTRFEDPHPQLTGIEKRVLRYRRRDGVELSATLYLPAGYREGQKLPLVVWAYPIEFNDKATAGQVRAAPSRFIRLSGTSPLMFLTRGYAVLDRTAMPIVGDPDSMNDTFIEQIADSARAAIDAAVAEGVADRQRVGIAGHSYGAFMVANLLAHTDLFRAGIARSGAYNRSLTPFGFQSERRTLWEAPSVYSEISPLFAADRLSEPILLIHGEIDANAGTYPAQSRQLFEALAGTGGTARLVILPHESHAYEARESVLHVLAESFDWFDKYVKGV